MSFAYVRHRTEILAARAHPAIYNQSDHNRPLRPAVSRPARVFAWLEDTHPAILETLIAPLVDDTGHMRGTLWIAHHEPDSRCTCEDVRILEQLAQQLMLALELQEHANDRERALLFKDAMIDDVNHRTKNTLQVASALLTMQANATSSMEARGALLDGHARVTLRRPP